MKMPEYTITKISDHFYRIRNYIVHLNLIIGTNKVALIDTGFGQTSILDFIRSQVNIGDKEILVFNTHTHVDHCRGNFPFSTIYVHQGNLLPNGYLGGYLSYIKSDPRVDFKRRYGIELEGLFEPRTFDHIQYHFIKQGDSFDLGGVHLEVIETPGHTLYDVALYWREEKILFTGDSFDTLIWTYFENAATRDEYIETIDKVLNMPVNDIYTGHSTKPRDKAFLLTMKQVLASVNYEQSTVTPRETLPREGAEALDYKISLPVNSKIYDFKVQYHPTKFLNKRK